MLLNSLLFLLILLPGLNPLGWILAIPVTGVFALVSGVWQALWVYLDRRFRFPNAIRCVGFVLPIVAVLALANSGFEPTRPINQQRPAASDTGTYLAIVSAEPAGWTVEVQSKSGEPLYREQTDFVPHLNVYWIWDSSDRLWLYNSDDGRVHCWRVEPDGEWRHTEWGYGHTKETDLDIGPPPQDLYPD